MEKGLHKVFSPGPVNGFAATVRAMSGTTSFEYEFHVAPFKAELLRLYRRCQGLGHQQSGGQPYVGSYIVLARPGRIQEKQPLTRVILLAPAVVPFGFSHPEHLGLRVGVFG